MLDQIAAELLLKIAVLLDLRTVLRCRQTCRRLREILDGNMTIQYRIQLALAGLDDAPHAGMSVAERLEKLRIHQRVWAELDAREIFSQTTENGVHIVVFPHAGIWVHTEDGSPSSLWLHRIPSTIRGIPPGTWKFEDVGFETDINRLFVDPAQDLLVAIERADAIHWQQFSRVHLLSLSSGTCHPSTRGPISTHDELPGRFAQHKIFGVQGAYLGLYTNHASPYYGHTDVIILNWMTGAIHLWLCGFLDVNCVFLPNHFVLVLSAEYGQDIEAYYTQPYLMVFDYVHGSGKQTDCSSVQYICKFLYPTFKDDIGMSDFALSLSGTNQDTSYTSEHQVPFLTSAEETLVTISMDLWTVWKSCLSDVIDNITHVVPASTFMRYAQAYDRLTVVYEWGQWSTQTFMLRVDKESCHFAWGSKLMTCSKWGPQKGLRSYEFNQCSVQVSMLPGYH
ncbi:hypothetical protein OBBRIDRAFT_630098 [Obba rivulosa]|uniref:F-box domain-containing protein n=1 Tax=Obba rivulosa TaxID=1052685 RepID=A0A8E2DNJ9_9APHY|nr:hypothetical protein OBBRIDRAFT_630098 [Obba rivulosa]